MEMARFLILLLLLLFGQTRQGTAGDHGFSSQDKGTVRTLQGTPTTTHEPFEHTQPANSDIHHQPNHNPFSSSVATLDQWFKRISRQLGNVQTTFTTWRSMSYSFWVDAIRFESSLSASWNITAYKRRDMMENPRTSAEVAANALQWAKNRKEETAAIAAMSGLRVDEVPWVARKLEGVMRSYAGTKLYDDVITPLLRYSCYKVLQRFSPLPLPEIYTLREPLFTGGEISWRQMGELRHREEKDSRAEVIPSIGTMMEFLPASLISWDTMKEGTTAAKQGNVRRSVGFFFESVTERGWIIIRFWWTVWVFRGALNYVKNYGWKEFRKVFVFYTGYFFAPEISRYLGQWAMVVGTTRG